MEINESRILLKEHLTKTLPPVVARHKIDECLGGVFSEKYLANLDSSGNGPRRFKFGRKAVYLREDFVEWLLARLSIDKEPKDE